MDKTGVFHGITAEANRSGRLETAIFRYRTARR